MPAGRMRERVTIEVEARAEDGAGGYAHGWGPVANGTVWARVESPTGRESLLAQQIQAAVSHVVTIRQRDDLVPAMRVMWRGVPLNIRAILPAERRGRTMMRLLCEAGVAT